MHPARRSEGGRRLYGGDAGERLRYILALRELGFSLGEICGLLEQEDGEGFAKALATRRRELYRQVLQAQAGLQAINSLGENAGIQDVQRAAETLQRVEQLYQITCLYSERLQNAVLERYKNAPLAFLQTHQRYITLLEQALALCGSNEPPHSGESQRFAGKWWSLVQEFVGGDLSLASDLVSFATLREGWHPDLAAKQQRANAYIGAVTDIYLANGGIALPGTP